MKEGKELLEFLGEERRAFGCRDVVVVIIFIVITSAFVQVRTFPLKRINT